MRPGRGRLILLVEDNANDERLTLEALKRARVPAAIHVARDGVEALDFLYGDGHLPHPPDLIFLDIKLPKYNGLEVLQQIRNHRETAKVPVIMLTSSDDWGDVDRSYALGANSYIRKAIDVDQYIEEVRTAGIYWTQVNVGRLDES